MGAFDHHVSRSRNKPPFLSRLIAPQHEDDSSRLGIHQPDQSVRKRFPPLPSMGMGRMGPNGQNRVQHEYPLPGPGFQTSVVRNAAPDIVTKLAIEIFQRWRQCSHMAPDGKTQPMGHAWRGIGILAEQYYSHPVVGRQFQGSKNVRPVRKDRAAARHLLIEKGIEGSIGLTRLFPLEKWIPVGWNGWQHEDGVGFEYPHEEPTGRVA